MSTRLFGLVLATILLATAHSAQAQQTQKVPRIGLLFTGESSQPSPNVEAFRQGLRNLGYVEGKTIALEYRFAEGKLDHLSALATELVHRKVSVIVTGGGPPTRAAKNATNSIPIVMVNIGDPVALGFVASLAKPGKNITGLSGVQTLLGGKRLELLKEIVPQLSRVAVLVNREVPGYATQMKEVEIAAQALGLQLQTLKVREGKDLENAFANVKSGRARALLGLQNPTFTSLQERIAQLAVKNRIPTIYGDARFPESNGLMSYGASATAQYRRAATYVDKILKGTKPADIPVEQPTKFEFIINLKAAKQIGLTIPPNVLARADRVIR
jgi:putative tryptophan/tyrosine transport system substrate-binding protein